MILMALIGDFSDENDHIEVENFIQKTISSFFNHLSHPNKE